MSLETDLLIDRRRLKRRLLFWKAIAAVAVVAMFVVLVNPNRPKAHIARLTVKGEITDTKRMIDAVNRMVADDNAKALIVQIASPGGGVYASVALHDAIARAASKKPVVAVMGSVAASGGFMIAMPAWRVFAGPSTLTGSIGVIAQLPEFSGLLDKVGVTAETITSGKLKDQPNPAHRLSDDGRAYLNGLIGDMFDQFVDIVAKGRHMDEAKIREIADGRAFTGRQALKLGLVDQMGTETTAEGWLVAGKMISSGLPIEDLRTTTRREDLFGETLLPILTLMLKTVLYQGVALDGPKALWQP